MTYVHFGDWYLVRSHDGRFRYVTSFTPYHANMLQNGAMSDYYFQVFASKQLAVLALSSPNVRVSNDEPDPRMLCKCKHGCNKESGPGSIFCSDCTRACTKRIVEPWSVNWYSTPSCYCDNIDCCNYPPWISFVLGNCLQTDFSQVCPFIHRPLSQAVCSEIYLSCSTLYFLIVSSELLRGLSSVLLV